MFPVCPYLSSIYGIWRGFLYGFIMQTSIIYQGIWAFQVITRITGTFGERGLVGSKQIGIIWYIGITRIGSNHGYTLVVM